MPYIRKDRIPPAIDFPYDSWRIKVKNDIDGHPIPPTSDENDEIPDNQGVIEEDIPLKGDLPLDFFYVCSPILFATY